jgi:hypothetical protein
MMNEERTVKHEDGTATFYTKRTLDDGTVIYYAQEWLDGHVVNITDVSIEDWDKASSDNLPIDYNWLEQNVVAFISQGGVGHYDVDDMEPSELAEFMVDYWRETAHEMPDWFDARSRQWCIEQLAESFAADRS